MPAETAAAGQLGACLAAYGGAGLAAALDGVTAAGLCLVDLPTDSTLRLADFRTLADPAERRALAQRLRRAGIVVGCVSNSRDSQLILGPHGPHTDPVLAGDTAAKRAHGLAAAQVSIELAAELGAPSVRLMLGCPDHSLWLDWWGSDRGWQDNLDAWVTAATPLVRQAARAGVRVLVEPHPKQVCYDPLSIAALLATAEQAGVAPGLCLDPANVAAVGHDPVELLRGWGPALAAVHVKDLQRWTGTGRPPGSGWSRYGPQPHIRFRTMGNGELPWPAMVAALQDEGFTGPLYVEHEDTLIPRGQGISLAATRLRELRPAHAPEGRTW
ncbi:MAG TPA: sugar phosphate isomerase/epimerase family protein [Jatrophihabitans sp.]|nr:sugar phosphate isomerase/epimerase family protein [Jatrophihabitans sp.]